MQGAPRSFGNAGAEIERMEEPRSRVVRTVEDLPTRNEKTTQTTQTHLAHGPGSLHNNNNEKDGRCQDEQTKTSEMNHACEPDEPKRIEPGNTSRPTLATEPVHALESTLIESAMALRTPIATAWP